MRNSYFLSFAGPRKQKFLHSAGYFIFRKEENKSKRDRLASEFQDYIKDIVLNLMTETGP